jgi:steroid delta-isomerase-like uncharacterized protein
MPHDKKTFLHRWFDEVWNQGCEEAIDRMLAPDAVGDGLTHAEGTKVINADGFKLFYRNFRQAIPDLQIVVEDTVIEGDKLSGRCRCRGTHWGPGLGVPPTGRKVDFRGMVMVRLRDGLIAESWNCFDFEKMRAQIAGVDRVT